MDVSSLIAASSSNSRSIEVIKEVPLQVDAGLLAVFDSNELDEEAYRSVWAGRLPWRYIPILMQDILVIIYRTDTEAYLQATARDGVQALINGLFNLPIRKSGDGPLAMLPPIETALPRAKPLPKPKPPTKWEQFAAAKGIQKTRRERKVWDEEKQEWVNRWGRGGKNKDVEEQWAVEVPANARMSGGCWYSWICTANDYDPFKEARDERKARVAKNEKQRLANAARAEGSSAAALKDEKKSQLNRQLTQTRSSTASMGKWVSSYPMMFWTCYTIPLPDTSS
jgi:regulator of ribosome biosynthesis